MGRRRGALPRDRSRPTERKSRRLRARDGKDADQRRSSRARVDDLNRIRRGAIPFAAQHVDLRPDGCDGRVPHGRRKPRDRTECRSIPRGEHLSSRRGPVIATNEVHDAGRPDRRENPLAVWADVRPRQMRHRPSTAVLRRSRVAHRRRTPGREDRPPRRPRSWVGTASVTSGASDDGDVSRSDVAVVTFWSSIPPVINNPAPSATATARDRDCGSSAGATEASMRTAAAAGTFASGCRRLAPARRGAPFGHAVAPTTTVAPTARTTAAARRRRTRAEAFR